MGTRTLGRFRSLSQQMQLGWPEIDCKNSVGNTAIIIPWAG